MKDTTRKSIFIRILFAISIFLFCLLILLCCDIIKSNFDFIIISTIVMISIICNYIKAIRRLLENIDVGLNISSINISFIIAFSICIIAKEDTSIYLLILLLVLSIISSILFFFFYFKKEQEIRYMSKIVSKKYGNIYKYSDTISEGNKIWYKFNSFKFKQTKLIDEVGLEPEDYIDYPDFDPEEEYPFDEYLDQGNINI